MTIGVAYTSRRACEKASMIEVRPLAGALGAEVFGVNIAKSVGDSDFSEIHRAFLEHLVLFFPHQQPLSPERHTAFAARFGEVDYDPFAYPIRPPAVVGHPQILVNLKEASDRSINVGGLWHADVTFRERPHKAAIIYAKDAPPFGGDTMFANQYLAYDSLSAGMRGLIAGLRAEHCSAMVHGSEAARSAATSRMHAPRLEDRSVAKSLQQAAEPRWETTEHPVVRTHPETGRKALYVNRGFATRFVGMSVEESKPLLEFLWTHATRPEFTCRYRWSQNDVGVWDNRCTLHYALNDYYGHRREFHRISVHEEARPT
jgi:taurine dioxygenase